MLVDGRVVERVHDELVRQLAEHLADALGRAELAGEGHRLVDGVIAPLGVGERVGEAARAPRQVRVERRRLAADARAARCAACRPRAAARRTTARPMSATRRGSSSALPSRRSTRLAGIEDGLAASGCSRSHFMIRSASNASAITRFAASNTASVHLVRLFERSGLEAGTSEYARDPTNHQLVPFEYDCLRDRHAHRGQNGLGVLSYRNFVAKAMIGTW